MDVSKLATYVVLTPQPDSAIVAKLATYVVLRPPSVGVIVSTLTTYAVMKPGTEPGGGDGGTKKRRVQNVNYY